MIDELSNREKSILLAKAMEWQPVPYHDPNASWYKMRHEMILGNPAATGGTLVVEPARMDMFVGIETAKGERVSKGDQPYDDDDLEKHWARCPNLYDPANMALSYRVRQWADELMANGLDRPDDFDAIEFAWNQVHLPANRWMRGWLDAIYLMVEDAELGAMQ